MDPIKYHYICGNFPVTQEKKGSVKLFTDTIDDRLLKDAGFQCRTVSLELVHSALYSKTLASLFQYPYPYRNLSHFTCFQCKIGYLVFNSIKLPQLITLIDCKFSPSNNEAVFQNLLKQGCSMVSVMEDGKEIKTFKA